MLASLETASLRHLLSRQGTQHSSPSHAVVFHLTVSIASCVERATSPLVNPRQHCLKFNLEEVDKLAISHRCSLVSVRPFLTCCSLQALTWTQGICCCSPCSCIGCACEPCRRSRRCPLMQINIFLQRSERQAAGAQTRRLAFVMRHHRTD